MKVVKCTEATLPAAAALFNAYRMFYEQQSDLAGAHAYLRDKLDNNRSIIFLLLDATDQPIGFSQLYPSFCSVEMKPICYLYDLFVEPASRGQGHSKFFMNDILDYFKGLQVKRITLDTAVTNTIAQGLYESIGFQPEKKFISYHYKY